MELILRQELVAGIGMTSPKVDVFNFAFRLEFGTTNNVKECEALILALQIAKDMGINVINIIGY